MSVKISSLTCQNELPRLRAFGHPARRWLAQPNRIGYRASHRISPRVGAYGGGSEAANALAAPAIAAVFQDATGKVLRRLPLKRPYIQALLKS